MRKTHSALKKDLSLYGIVCEGELRQNADIRHMVAYLTDDNLKRRFIAGLADTIGSMAKSHRRFTDEVQILSFELKGFNFSFICELCQLLYSVNCIPDQILWNHPNFHCASDPYYSRWNKGFKLRIRLDQYAHFGAFAFRTKAESAQANRKLQQQEHMAAPCPTRDMNITPSCVHPAENDAQLPDCIRGGHFIHNRHVCAVLGCKHAPYDKVSRELLRAGEIINPFPILSKKSCEEIEDIIGKTPLLQRSYIRMQLSIKVLYRNFQANHNGKLFSAGFGSGYPISEVLKAVAFIVAEDGELAGKRPKGGYIQLIERHLRRDPNAAVEMRKPDLLTPLILLGNGRGALVGAENPRVYSKLVSRAPDNEYKLIVRPITEEDLADAK